MTQALSDQLGPSAVPHLKTLLRDNVVAYLAYLGRDAAAVSALTGYASRLTSLDDTVLTRENVSLKKRKRFIILCGM